MAILSQQSSRVAQRKLFMAICMVLVVQRKVFVAICTSFTSDSQSPCCTEQKCYQRKRELNYRKICEVQAFAILILNHLAPFLNYEL